MNESQREVDAGTKARLQRQTARQTQEQEVEDHLSFQRDPLTLATVRPGDASSARAHASLLNRATTSQPSRAAHSLLQLQRTYGNNHVQRVVALMREGQGDEQVVPEVEEAIQRARGGGQALDSGVRVQMESAFGTDFGGVRVHTGAEADALNRAVSARAFTTGVDIFFRGGEYNPQGSGGRELLAHELTHVLQQSDGAHCKLTLSQPGDVYEEEAEQMARAVMTGNSIQNGNTLHFETAGVIARQAAVTGDTPYIPGEMSRLYYHLSPRQRARVNIEVDRIFREQTGVTRSLNWNDPNDAPLARIWLRLRDDVMSKRTGKPEPASKASVTEPAAEVQPPREEPITVPQIITPIAHGVTVASGAIHIGELVFTSLEAVGEFFLFLEAIVLPLESLLAAIEATEAGKKWGKVQGASYAIVALALGQPIPEPVHLRGIEQAEGREGWEEGVAMFRESPKPSKRSREELQVLAQKMAKEMNKNYILWVALNVHLNKIAPDLGLDLIYLDLSKKVLEERFLWFGGMGTYRRAVEYRPTWPVPGLENRARSPE